MTPLLKKASLNPIIPASYRPVNQLVRLLKILERCVFGQLDYLEENRLLHPNRHSGRAGHSTKTPLSRCTTSGWKTSRMARLWG